MKTSLGSVIIILIFLLCLLCGCSRLISGDMDDWMIYRYEIDQSFYRAIMDGNIEAAKECVEDGADINKIYVGYPIKTQKIPLIEVLIKRDFPILNYLLEQGADVNCLDLHGISPFMYSIGAKTGVDYSLAQLEYAELFMKYDADLNQMGKKDYNAVDYAVLAGKLDIVEFLLDNGGVVSPKSFSLAYENNITRMEMRYGLLKKILEESIKSGYHPDIDLVLEASLLGDSSKTIQLIKQNGLKYEYAQNILFASAAFCDKETLALVLDKGATLDERLLYIATEYGNVENIKFLLDAGMNINTSGNPEALIHIAVLNNDYDVVKLLLERGIIFQPNGWSDNRNPLSCAAKNGNIDIVNLFIDYGYPLNNETIFLAMDAAAQGNQLTTLKYFLDKGYSPNLTLSDDSLLAYSCLRGKLDAVKILLEFGADINGPDMRGYPLRNAITFGHTDIAKYLIEKGADVDAAYQYEDGSNAPSPLMIATEHGYADIIMLLVENGADLERKCWGSEETVIIKAAGTSNHILQYFIDQGANINYQSKHGETALMRAVTLGHVKNVELLLKCDVNQNHKNSNSQTALDIAQKYKNNNIIKLLKAASK